jgi:hypothetical protein
MSELISTALFNDPDPDGTDKYGMLPLIMEMPDADEDDDSGSEKRGKGGDDGGDEDDALIEPSSIDVSVPAGTELPDEDDGAFSTLTARGADDLSPGEAEDLINYMRPMSEEERAFLEESPLNRDIERVDDPAHTDDVLRAGKGDHGVDTYLRDTSYGDLMNDRAPSDTWGEARRHRRRHHHRHHRGQLLQPGYGLQPGQPGYASPLPGQPGYGLLPGQPGYGFQPGQPGYVAPSVDAATAAFNAAHGITTPATSTALTSYYPGASVPIAPTQYYPGTSTPIPTTQFYPGTSTPIPTATLPYQQPTYIPGSSDTYSDANYILGRDRAKVQMVRGLGRKLVLEHANWLADQDQSSGIAVRPRSFYENVGKLWAADKLRRAQFPMSTTMGNWTPSHKDFVVTADGLLGETAPFRKRFSDALGSDFDMGGWSPWGAIKSVEHGVEKGASLAYRGAKFGLTKPFEYTYKGIKYVGEKAMQLALAPIKAVVRRFRNKMVNRKAAELAQLRGLTTPGPTEKAQAAAWAKKVTQQSGNRFARAAASLMGRDPEYGVRRLNVSLEGDDVDVMGLAPLLLYPLIALGAVGLAVILEKIYNAAFSHSSAPAQDPNAAQAYDPSASDPGSADPGATDPGQDYSPDAGYPDDGSYDSSGYAGPRKRPSLTIEQLNRLPKNKRQRAQQLIRSGHIRLA